MADAPEIRSDSAPIVAETPAMATPAVEAVAPVEMIATPEPSKPVEMAALPEPPKAAEIPPETEPAAMRSSVSSTPTGASVWANKIRASLAGIIPSVIPVNRMALAAGGIGFAAGAVLLGGTIGLMGVGRPTAAPTPAPAPWTSAAEETRVLKQSVGKLETQVASLKATIDASNKHATAQRAQIASRYDQNARTQTEMQTRLVKIGDTVERLEKRVTAAAAVETTGSVAPRYAAAAAAGPAAAPAPTPSPATVAVPEPKVLPEPPIVTGWTIRDVFRGRALVANKRGVFEAAPGLFLPELGRVEAVARRNGHWVVVTEKGVIATMHRPRSANGYDAD